MKNFYVDYFVYNKRHHWFILPSVVFYYDRYSIYDDLHMAPSWGLTIRWLTLMAGFQIQMLAKEK